MSWWKTLFGWSAVETTAPAESSPHLHTDAGLPALTENEDSLYIDAARIVLSTRKCSISSVQRHLKIGYNRAAQLIEALEDDRVISEMDLNGNRHLLSEQERNAARQLPPKAELGRHGKAVDKLLADPLSPVALAGGKSKSEPAPPLKTNQEPASSLIDSMGCDPKRESFETQPKLHVKTSLAKQGKNSARPPSAQVTLPPLSGRVTGSQKCGFEIVGESHYQPALRQLRNSRHMATDNDFVADIVIEPDNPHDGNACAVYIESFKIGYLPRDAAAEFVRQMAEVGLSGVFRIQAQAKLSGGWGDRPFIGVLLNLPPSVD